jgi:hypothetical protein
MISDSDFRDPRSDFGRGDRVLLYYVLSTWNPYQVVLMRHELSFRELAALG